MTDLFENSSFLDAFHAVPEIYARLADEESTALYGARLKYLQNVNAYMEVVNAFTKEWQIPDLDRAYEDFHFSCILLWGCREIGLHARGILARSKYADFPMYFVSNTKKRRNTTISIKWHGGECIETPVIGPDDIYPYLSECVVLVLTRGGRYAVMDQLANLTALPPHRVLFTRPFFGQYLTAYRPNQYFDVFKPKSNEVFIDAGALNGATSLQFCNWCGGNYEKIVAFEPNPRMSEVCERFFETHGLTRATVVPKAAWSGMEDLSFSIDYENYEQGGAHVSELAGTEKVPADSIDHVLNGERATFIKMDIEGSEYQALLGAEQTIKKYHPRLAISLYHKPEDVLEIPYLIHKMNPDYRFIIRHYASNMTETVLYAFDEEQ